MTGSSRESRLSDAFVKLADTLIADYDVVDLLQTLVEECTDLLDAQAGGLILADTTGDLQLVASTSEGTDFVEVVQLSVGLGPCVQCFETGVPVTVGDIDKEGAPWPDFRAAALNNGFRSVHATPMRLRGVVIGAMNLFGTKVGALNAADIAVAQALTDVATIGILQERNIRETHVVTEQLQRALDSRILIEQAKGVLSQTGSMDMDEAFAAIRHYARRNNQSLREVSAGITNRTLNILAIPAVARKDDARS